MEFPAIIINFKAYESVLGESALRLARLIEKIVHEKGVSIVPVPSVFDVATLLSNLTLPVMVQHVDPVEPGAQTGSVPPAAAAAIGASGTLLNHAERRLPADILKKTVEMCRQVGLFTLVCAESLDRIQEVSSYAPDAIAYEPPELIGGAVSVSSAQPDIIRAAVALSGKIPLLVGAGVKTGEDVRVARSLGAQGVLLASGVVLSPDPEKVLYNLAEGL